VGTGKLEPGDLPVLGGMVDRPRGGSGGLLRQAGSLGRRLLGRGEGFGRESEVGVYFGGLTPQGLGALVFWCSEHGRLQRKGFREQGVLTGAERTRHHDTSVSGLVFGGGEITLTEMSSGRRLRTKSRTYQRKKKGKESSRCGGGGGPIILYEVGEEKS